MSSTVDYQTEKERPQLDLERQKKAREYSSLKRKWSIVEAVFVIAVILLILFSGFSNYFIGLFNFSVIPSAIIYFLILAAAFEIVTFPLGYYSGYILPSRYGISTQTFRQWLSDVLKSGLIELVLGTAAVAVVYWLLTSFPEIWWLMAWGLMLIVTVIFSLLAPVMLMPIFYKVKPMEDSGLKTRLENLAAKAGAKVQGIYTLDFSSKGTTANAGLMGIGKTRRIVVSDTLISSYPPDEIEVIIAHEIAHHLHGDIFRLFVVQSAVYLLIFKIADLIFGYSAVQIGFTGMTDPAALPLLILIFTLLAAAVSPISNAYSRKMEIQADAYAIALTRDPDSFIDAMTRLTDQNLAVADPPKWEEFIFHDHPSYNKRKGLAEYFKLNGNSFK
jgi:STE24 endopeptidase